MKDDPVQASKSNGQLDDVVSGNQLKAIQNLEDFLTQNQLEDNHMTSILYQVYEDLQLIRKWTNMRVVKNKNRVYLAGNAPAEFDSVFPGREAEKDLDRTQIVVPIPAFQKLSPVNLQELCEGCIHPELKIKLRCITVAIVDDDSTTAYYRVFDTFEEITHPQWKQKKKRKEDDVNGTNEPVNRKLGNDDKSDSDETDSDSD